MFRSNAYNLLWIISGGVIALLMFLPLKWVGPHIVPATMTTSKIQYTGTIWKGQISGLTDLDQVTYTLKPLNVLFANLPLTFLAVDKGLNVRGKAGRSRAKDILFKINISDLPLPDPRLRGLAGLATARIDTVVWDKSGSCEDIKGTAQSNVLTQNRSLFNWSGPVISGPISCGANGAYVFSLSGRDNTQIIEARISISAQGSYSSDITVTTQDQNASMALPLFGFEEKQATIEGRQFVLIEQGRWQ